jgi:hypothetical protein
MVDLARGVVVCRRVWRREPFPNVLIYLVPCGRVSICTMQPMEVSDHEHFISSKLSLTFLVSGWTMAQHKAGSWSDGLHTVFEVKSDLHSLSKGHPDLIQYQVI